MEEGGSPDKFTLEDVDAKLFFNGRPATSLVIEPDCEALVSVILSELM